MAGLSSPVQCTDWGCVAAGEGATSSVRHAVRALDGLDVAVSIHSAHYTASSLTPPQVKIVKARMLRSHRSLFRLDWEAAVSLLLQQQQQ